MRVETTNGHKVLSGIVLPSRCLKEGQTWAPLSGAASDVTILLQDGDWITFQGAALPAQSMLSEAFQELYALVLTNGAVPADIAAVAAVAAVPA